MSYDTQNRVKHIVLSTFLLTILFVQVWKCFLYIEKQWLFLYPQAEFFLCCLFPLNLNFDHNFIWEKYKIRPALRSGKFEKAHPGLGRCPGEGNDNPLQYSCLENSMYGGAWWAAVHGVTHSHTWLSNFTFTFHFHALEKEMATHSGIVAWKIPCMEEPGRLQSMGLQRGGHDWAT